MSAELWNRAAKYGLCKTLDELGSGLAQAGAWSLAAAAAGGGSPAAGAGFAAMGAAAAANVTFGWGCTNDPSGPAPGDVAKVGCTEVDGCGWLYAGVEGQPPLYGPPYYDAKQITAAYGKTINDGGTGIRYLHIDYVTCDGTNTTLFTGLEVDGSLTWIEPQEGSSCISEPDSTPTSFGPYETYEYNDVDTGCTLNVTVNGFVDEGNGRIGTMVQVDALPEETLRASGGRIGGCNFSPTMVYLPPGGGGGTPGGPPNFPIPDPLPDPGDDKPWWLDIVSQAAAVAAGNLVAQALSDLFATEYAGTEYVLNSVCQLDDEGKPIQEKVEVPIPASKTPVAILERVDALVPLIQGLKDFKQPICASSKSQGDARTISFISDETSPYGNNRLRKRFRYRSQSGLGLDGVVDHWKDFVWNAGPVCVQHKGASWGAPQCWAESIDEGKRVILHAAAEAGIDPNQVGQWSVSGSDNARYGVPGTMRVNTSGGYYWITERLGSNGRPMVEKS